MANQTSGEETCRHRPARASLNPHGGWKTTTSRAAGAAIRNETTDVWGCIGAHTKSCVTVARIDHCADYDDGDDDDDDDDDGVNDKTSHDMHGA